MRRIIIFVKYIAMPGHARTWMKIDHKFWTMKNIASQIEDAPFSWSIEDESFFWSFEDTPFFGSIDA
ncbi:MAG: hypothetical protein MUC94_02745 [bacterium]|nr:hypothetical protein [bacterium]